MPSLDDAGWEELARVLAGEAPPEVAARVRAHVARDPQMRIFVDAVEHATLGGKSSADVDAALHRVRMRMRRAPAHSLPRKWLPLAATIVLAAGATWFLRSGSDAGSASFALAATEYRTLPGVSDSVVLADGTTAILGPGSELTLSADYPNAREVSLSGQARFDVVHDAARPFTVRTQQAVVTDIGTVFTINDYDGASIDVAVQSGSVRLQSNRAGDSGVVLKAGEAAAIDTRGVLTKTDGSASDDYVGWLRGRLVFREAPMIKVRSELRRWYGVELVVADSAVAAGHLTATFDHDSLARILDIVALTFGASHEIRGDTIILKARRSAGR